MARFTAPRLPALLASCVALAALSLALPWGLGFDPWGWVLWGREIVDPRLPFNTVGYPSWKPLPVGFTIVFALFGAAAPYLWLVVARAGSLFAVVLACRLGHRLGGRLAAALGAGGVLLLSGWLRYFAGGASEPLLVALVLWAVERHIDGRRGQALGLWFGAALLRPEAWPFLLAYAIHYGRTGRRRAAAAAVLLALVPALWLVPEWLGAGDPFHAAALARASAEARATQRLAQPALEALMRAGGLVFAPLILASFVAVVDAVRRRRPLPLALALVAVGWVAVVAAMTAAGYPGIARFSLPAAALVSVLGAVGLAQLAAGPSSPRRRHVAGLAAVLVLAPFAVERVGTLTIGVEGAVAQERMEDQLGRVVTRMGGASRVLACPAIAVDGPFRTPLAWRLGVAPTTLTASAPASLVFRLHRRWLLSYGGRVRLPALVPRAPVRALARVGAWEVTGSATARGCVPRRLASAVAAGRRR